MERRMPVRIWGAVCYTNHKEHAKQICADYVKLSIFERATHAYSAEYF
jgi:hypothetical protein